MPFSSLITCAAGEDGDVFEHRLAPVAEAGGLYRADLESASQLVDHQGGKRFAFNVFGDDQKRLAHLGDLLENGQQDPSCC